jgi:hypothetical protein
MLPPTPLEQAQHIRGLLTEELQTLKLLEEEPKGHPVQDIHNPPCLPRQGVGRHQLPAKVCGRTRDGHDLMLTGPLHRAGTDGGAKSAADP